MEITINPAKDIVVVAERKKTISKLTILEITDNPNEKKVVAITKEVGRLTLWANAEYDAIGQWTDTDVEEKIHELYS
jgi:hypothetical protein